MDFLHKPSAWFSKFYLRVQSKNCGRKSFLIFLFRIFFGFWEENFPDFRPKNFIKFSKLPSTCPEEQFVAWNFFLKFWIVLDLLQKPSAWFSNFYLRVKSKNCGRNSFLIFLFRFFFGFWEKNFPDFRPKNFIKFSKLPSTCREEQFLAWNFFLKFWIVLDFLQKPSAWFSNFYLRFKSKNCGRNSFLIFLFRIFSDFERKFFQTFCEKSSKSCQNYLLRVQRNNLWLEIFFESFESFWYFLQKPLAWFSNFYLRVQSKNCGRNSFLIFFSDFFRILSEKFFRLSAKKLQKVVKTTFYVSRGTVCGLKFFSKILNRFGFSAQTIGMVLKILSTCPE